VSIALVHYFHSQVGAVDDVSPGVDDPTLGVDDALVEVEPVQVKRHRADAQGGEPDADDGPGGEEEVQAPGVVEAGVLEDQTSEVTVGGNDVVGLFFLPEFISSVLAFVLGGLTH